MADEKAKKKAQAKNRSRILIEPAPNSPGTVIDPKDPMAQRKFEIQQRGGTYNDRIKIDPWSPFFSPSKDRMKRG